MKPCTTGRFVQVKPCIGRRVRYEMSDGDVLHGRIIERLDEKRWTVRWEAAMFGVVQDETFSDPNWAPVQLIPNGVEYMLLLLER